MDKLPFEIQTQIVQVFNDDAQKNFWRCHLPPYVSPRARFVRKFANIHRSVEWQDISSSLSALLGLTLMNSHWYGLANPTLRGCLDQILRYLWPPPWQDTLVHISQSDMHSRRSLTTFIRTILDLPESYHASAVRKMAPEKPYRFALPKPSPVVPTWMACRYVWAQGLPEDSQNTQIASELAVLKGFNEDFINVEYLHGSNELEISTAAMVNKDTPETQRKAVDEWMALSM